jgi:UDPglucose 6-dehydrogenase
MDCPKYSKGTLSYGEPFFLRDNRPLAALPAHMGASSGLAEATDIINGAQIDCVTEIVKSHRAEDDAVGVLGLAYKPNTDVFEESFGFLLALELSSANLPVNVYDPSADVAAALHSYKNIRVAASAQECIAESRVVVLATPWQEFRELRPALWARPGYSAPRVVIDCWRALSHLDGVEGLRYIKLGFGGAAEKPVTVSSSAD